MKILKCKLCLGEVDIISGEHFVNKKTKCNKCGFSNINLETQSSKGPEVIVMRRRIN